MNEYEPKNIHRSLNEAVRQVLIAEAYPDEPFAGIPLRYVKIFITDPLDFPDHPEGEYQVMVYDKRLNKDVPDGKPFKNKNQAFKYAMKKYKKMNRGVTPEMFREYPVEFFKKVNRQIGFYEPGDPDSNRIVVPMEKA